MLRQQLEEEFKTCDEAKQHGPSTDHDFTVSLYWRYLGHTPDANLDIHTSRLQPTDGMTREHLEEEFKTCPEAQHYGPSKDHDFTVSLYWRYLGHAPDANLEVHIARLEILIAVIGDSVTAGYGDNCIPSLCSHEPPAVWVTSYQNAPVMPGCGYKYGWAPKLAWYLNYIGRNAKIVGQCTKGGATSKDIYDKGCGTITNNLNPTPTHVILLAGWNDGGSGRVGFTWYYVTEIGSQIHGPRKIHLQGNNEWPNNWNQTITSSQWAAGFQYQTNCDGHPNGTNYWKMAHNLLQLVNWDAPVT